MAGADVSGGVGDLEGGVGEEFGVPAGGVEEVVVAVTERMVERTIELRGVVRSIEANHDYSAVAEIER